MKLTIETAANGWIIRKEPDELDDRSELYVFSYTGSPHEVDEVNSFSDFLWQLNELIGPTTSRYSPARIHVQVKPGDKHDDFQEDDECK